jgi:hypothetical protein
MEHREHSGFPAPGGEVEIGWIRYYAPAICVGRGSGEIGTVAGYWDWPREVTEDSFHALYGYEEGPCERKECPWCRIAYGADRG